RLRFSGPKTSIICSPMTSLKTSIKTITYLSDIGCLEIQGASLITFYPITIQTLTIMIIVHIVKSEGEGALTPYKGSAWKTDFPTSRELS
ncbi:hypothetical protein E0L08_23680, partial [Escherichia coli]